MWIWIGSILLLLLIIIGIILMSKITFHLKVVKKNRDDSIIMNVKLLYGLISLHYEVPAIVIKSWQEGVWIEKNQSDNLLKGHASNGEQVINQEKVHKWKDEFREILSATQELKRWVKSTLNHVSVKQFDWSTDISLSDAAYTAMLTGMLWSLKSVLVGWLSYQISFIQRPKLLIVPVFGSPPLFITELTCVAEIRCSHAIYAAFSLLARAAKVKGGMRKWRSILFKK